MKTYIGFAIAAALALPLAAAAQDPAGTSAGAGNKPGTFVEARGSVKPVRLPREGRRHA